MQKGPGYDSTQDNCGWRKQKDWCKKYAPLRPAKCTAGVIHDLLYYQGICSLSTNVRYTCPKLQGKLSGLQTLDLIAGTGKSQTSQATPQHLAMNTPMGSGAEMQKLMAQNQQLLQRLASDEQKIKKLEGGRPVYPPAKGSPGAKGNGEEDPGGFLPNKRPPQKPTVYYPGGPSPNRTTYAPGDAREMKPIAMPAEPPAGVPLGGAGAGTHGEPIKAPPPNPTNLNYKHITPPPPSRGGSSAPAKPKPNYSPQEVKAVVNLVGDLVSMFTGGSVSPSRGGAGGSGKRPSGGGGGRGGGEAGMGGGAQMGPSPAGEGPIEVPVEGGPEAAQGEPSAPTAVAQSSVAAAASVAQSTTPAAQAQQKRPAGMPVASILPNKGETLDQFFERFENDSAEGRMSEAEYQSLMRNVWSNQPLHGKRPDLDQFVDGELTRIADEETADIRAACRRVVEAEKPDLAAFNVECRAAHAKAEASLQGIAQQLAQTPPEAAAPTAEQQQQQPNAPSQGQAVPPTAQQQPDNPAQQPAAPPEEQQPDSQQ